MENITLADMIGEIKEHFSLDYAQHVNFSENEILRIRNLSNIVNQTDMNMFCSYCGIGEGKMSTEAIAEKYQVSNRKIRARIRKVSRQLIDIFFWLEESSGEKSIIWLNLPPEIENVLWRARIRTIDNLKGYSNNDLLNYRNFGLKAVEKIRQALEEFSTKNI